MVQNYHLFVHLKKKKLSKRQAAWSLVKALYLKSSKLYWVGIHAEDTLTVCVITRMENVFLTDCYASSYVYV